MQKRQLRLLWMCGALALGWIGADSICLGVIPVIWTGTNITISEPTGGQDTLTPQVILKWDGHQGLYNAVTEQHFSYYSSPAGTLWAFGSLSNHNTLNYTNWQGLAKALDQVGRPMVVHLIADNIYLSLKLTSWGPRNGGLHYIRSTPFTVVTPGPLKVTVTSPTNATFFSAPAVVVIKATASETGGSVSNVQFRLNGASIGVSTAPPYGAELTGLSAGTYTVSAVATDATGTKATNSVQITVTAPAVSTISLSPPVLVGGQLQFGVSGLVSGKTNLVQASFDLGSSNNWVNISTNIPATTNMTVSGLDGTTPGARFFRVLQQP